MKVSVIIPAYNEEDYIGNTLQSVLAQTYKDIEIIVVNNNSKDCTKEKALQFQGVRVVDELEPGVQHARERGRREASGDIVANLDADCLPDPDWIEHAVRHIEKSDNVVAVSGPYDYYDGTPMFRAGSSFIQKYCFNPLHRVAYHAFGRGVFAMGGNIFIRADALEKIGGYNTAIKFYGDDTDTANRLLATGKVLYRNDVTVKSSARRFGKNGVIPVFRTYLINFLWVAIFGRPYHTKKNDAVR